MCVLDRAVEKERKGGGGESGEAREAFKGGGGGASIEVCWRR